MENNSKQQYNPANDGSISYRDVIDFVWRLRGWIILSVLAALLIAFVYVRMQTPMYQQSTWIMLNKNSEASSELRVIQELTGGNTTAKRIDNEVFILKSPSMMTKVVESLGLNSRYYSYGTPVAARVEALDKYAGFKQQEYYGNQPFAASLVYDDPSLEKQAVTRYSIRFRHVSDTTFLVRKFIVNGQTLPKEKTARAYGSNIVLDGATLCLSLTKPESMKEGRDYMATWTPAHNMAQGLVKRLTADVQKSARSSYNLGDVVILSITDNCPARARDILNTLVLATNLEAHDYSNQAGKRALEFIDGRLAELSSELGNAESTYQTYRSNNALVDISSQSQLALSVDQKNQEKLEEVTFQLQVLQMVKECLQDQSIGSYNSIPANVGVSDPGLNGIISNYNLLVLERERMVANSSETNPRVLTINSQLDVQKGSIEATVDNLMNVYRTKQREVQRNISTGKSRLSNMPTQELKMQQMNRKLDVIEPIYTMLQQKKEETQITMCAQSDNFRVLEPAFGSNAPLTPQKSKIYLLALLLGLCIPPAMVWLRMTLRTTVETKSDITSRTDTPVIATIAHKEGKTEGGIAPGGRDSCSESFGMLRANLKYMPDSKVFQVTSSLPGEGKSFVASNLAVSLSRLGKEVLIIGLDIRKPMLRTIFTEESTRATGTMVGYMLGKTTDLDKLPVQSTKYPGLSVIFAGPVPPNPMELLAKCNLEEILGYYRSRYDYVIIDSAPYLPVADSSFINPFADSTIYVVRSGVTSLKILDEFEEVTDNQSKPIKNVNIVLNDVDYSSSKYHYGYGKGYGYGYGYGYGHKYGYGSDKTYGYGYGYGYGESGRRRKKGNPDDKEKDLGQPVNK